MCRVMDDGKKEGQTAADGHSDLQVEAGGRSLAEAPQVGPADSLPSENTKGTRGHSPLPRLLQGQERPLPPPPTCNESFRWPSFLFLHLRCEPPCPTPLPLPGPSSCSRAEAAIPLGFSVAGRAGTASWNAPRGLQQ